MPITTYTSLSEDIRVYADRRDTPFITQIPRLISLAEQRIAKEVHGLGYKRFVTNLTDFTLGTYVLAKPAGWRETVSIAVGSGTGNVTHKFLKYRSYEYCRVFWPDTAATGVPRFYSDYDYEHYFIVPSTDALRPVEISYHERPIELSATNPENWTTRYAPDLILYATLLEVQSFLHRPDRIQEFQSLYDRAAAAISGEEQRRLTDETTARKDK